MLIFIMGFLRELLKWAQTICLSIEKSLSTDCMKHMLAEILTNHLCDFGGHALVFLATQKEWAWSRTLKSTNR